MTTGAPFQWAAIFHKEDINFTRGHHDLGWCVYPPPVFLRPIPSPHIAIHQLPRSAVPATPSNAAPRYESSEKTTRHKLPCKVSCAYCRSPIMDEGRNMILLFPSLLRFKSRAEKERFDPTCVSPLLPLLRGHGPVAGFLCILSWERRRANEACFYTDVTCSTHSAW